MFKSMHTPDSHTDSLLAIKSLQVDSLQKIVHQNGLSSIFHFIDMRIDTLPFTMQVIVTICLFIGLTIISVLTTYYVFKTGINLIKAFFEGFSKWLEIGITNGMKLIFAALSAFAEFPLNCGRAIVQTYRGRIFAKSQLAQAVENESLKTKQATTDETGKTKTANEQSRTHEQMVKETLHRGVPENGKMLYVVSLDPVTIDLMNSPFIKHRHDQESMAQFIDRFADTILLTAAVSQPDDFWSGNNRDNSSVKPDSQDRPWI